MSDFEIKVRGAEVVSTNGHRPIVNPLRRPRVGYKNMLIALVTFIATQLAVSILFWHFESRLNVLGISKAGFVTLFSLVYAAIYISVIAKRAVIWLVHFYQKNAPVHVRMRCPFEPSCSEYMILAVKKHGVAFGVIKGIRRLFRCRPPGGIDYP